MFFLFPVCIKFADINKYYEKQVILRRKKKKKINHHETQQLNLKDWMTVLLFPGDHHQNSEADGGPGEPGRWCRLAWEMEDKAHYTFPSGDEPFSFFYFMKEY